MMQMGLWWMLCCCSMSSMAAIYCPASINTAVNVHRCPKTEIEWKTASAHKNCTSEIQSCVRQAEFVYHCVINTYLNATVEVCAPSTNILGYTCAEYNIEGARIQEHVDTTCTSCPFRYPSTDAYKFQSCYNLIKRNQRRTTTEKIFSTLPSLQNTTFTVRPNKSKVSNVIIAIIVVGILAISAAVICVVFCIRRIKYQRTLTDQEERSIELSPLQSEEKFDDTGGTGTKKRFTVAIEIGRHFSGYGYSAKHDNIPRIPIDYSGKPKKIPSAVWYDSTTEEIKIGYDAHDQFTKCDGNPPKCIYYSDNLTIDYTQGDRCMQQYSWFLLGLLKAVLQFISQEHKNPNKADTDFVIIIKRLGGTSTESSESVKRYLSTLMKEAGVKENQIKFLLESDCVLRYVQSPKSEYFNGTSPTNLSLGRKDKIMILKTGHAGIQYDILETNMKVTKHHNEFNSVWCDKNPEEKLLAKFADQFKNVSLLDLKRDYMALCCKLLINLHKFKENPGETKHMDLELPEKLKTRLSPVGELVPSSSRIMIVQNKLSIG